jgi:K+ transporter
VQDTSFNERPNRSIGRVVAEVIKQDNSHKGCIVSCKALLQRFKKQQPEKAFEIIQAKLSGSHSWLIKDAIIHPRLLYSCAVDMALGMSK